MPGQLLAGACAALFLVPMVVTAHEPVLPAEMAEPVDLAFALAPDGTFQGAAGLEASVDTAGWSLVSDIVAGEAPRFVPASDLAATTGPWSALGSNGAGNGALNAQVRAVAVSGTNVYVGGDFTNAAGIATADYVAKWDGSTWSALGSNGAGNGALTDIVHAVGVSAGSVYVGGLFINAAGIAAADHIARWNGSAWSAMGSDGTAGALNADVYGLAASGTDVYVGGRFANAAGVGEADYLAKWNGNAWSALGSNGAGDGAIGDWVYTVVASGTNVYVGGFFANVAGIPTADRIARWNGSAWSALGSNGAGDGAITDPNYWVQVIAATGSDVYVGGYFRDVAGIAAADHLARWNGSSWVSVGGLGEEDGPLNSSVWAIAVTGNDVYVGGAFNDKLVRWSGEAWSVPGGGNPFYPSGVLVNGLAIAADGLYVGADTMNVAGIAAADHVARFNLIPFTDIYGSDFVDDIIWIYQEGITAGCTPTLYCPNANVTREQMASFLVRALDLPATGTDYFTDDEASGHEPDINSLRAAGITFGCTATTFCPAAKVSREQMASFLVRALDLPATGTDYFTDDEASGHEADINSLRASEITFGCTATTYCPGANVTRGQMAAFLHRAFGP